MIDLSFFDRSLREQRHYWTQATPHDQVLKHVASMGAVRMLKDNDVETEVVGSHLMASGNPLGVSAINERFDITLPEDFDAFYRVHDGGYLLFQELYRLMPVEEIIQEALVMQNRDDEPPTPWHFIRFCDLRDVGHIGLRLCPDRQWRVMLADLGYSLYSLINDKDLYEDYTWDDSFTLWLKRICATDGWPTGTHVYVPEDPPLLRLE